MTNTEIGKLYQDRFLEVQAFAYAMCQNKEDAEDIVSQVFAEMLENAGNIDPIGAKQYLYRSVHNRTINHYKKNVNHNDAISELDITDCDTESYPELHKSIACLPDRQAVAIYLHYWQKMSLDQIANEMQIPTNTVNTLLYRAKNKLREMMRNG